MTRNICAVDIGSNTVHMIIATVGPGETLTITDRLSELVRLGADINAGGAIGSERAARAEALLRVVAQRASAAGAEAVLGIATEGVRAASNAQEMLQRFSNALGQPITLISGLEEAALGFWGATSSLDDPREAVAVGDLGGGSCELVTGQQGQITWAQSLPLGSGRLSDMLADSSHPTEEDFIRLEQHARQTLAAVPRPPHPSHRLVAVGGTVYAMYQALGSPSHQRLTRGDLQRLQSMVIAQPLDVLANQHGISVDRVRLFVGGVAAWNAILEWMGLDHLLVSNRGIREGVIIAWLRAGNGWQQLARTAATV